MGFRLWFAYYASHSGATSIPRFSRQHGITAATIWTAAFVFMAFAQVITRVGILQARRVNADRHRHRTGPRRQQANTHRRTHNLMKRPARA